MLTKKDLPKKIECFLPPTVMLGPASNTRYAIIGGKWLECDETVTYELLQSRWSSPKPKSVQNKPAKGEIKVQIKSSTGKGHYDVEFKNERWSCTCPSFGFRRRCKHIDEVKARKH